MVVLNVVNSFCVVVVAIVVAWLVGSWLCLAFELLLPAPSWLVFFLVCYRGFANHERIRAHCGWVTLAGVVAGAVLFPHVQDNGRLSLADELFVTYGKFGLLNSTLMVAAGLMILIAVLECLNGNEDALDSKD